MCKFKFQIYYQISNYQIKKIKKSQIMKFHHKIDKLKGILYKNSYPRDLVDKCIKEFLDKILAPKPVVSTVPKKT